MPGSAFLAALLVVACALPSLGLQHVKKAPYVRAAAWRTITVKNERQLRAALQNPSLGWGDQRVVQLADDVLLVATLTIGSPVRIEGNCPANPGKKCTLRAARPQPLLHISGPAAVVHLGNLQLTGGQGSDGMAGALTASNHSRADVVACVLSANSAPSGGGALITSNAHINLVDSEVSGNVAQGCGGGITIRSGSLHMDRSTVESNSAAAGGGVCAEPGTLVTALNSGVINNALDAAAQQQAQTEAVGEGASTDSATATDGGVDILLQSHWEGAVGAAAEAYFEPIPSGKATLVGGGDLQPMSELPGSLPGKPAPFEVGVAYPRHLPAETAYEAAKSSWKRQKNMPRRALRQSTPLPAGASLVNVNSESNLAAAIKNRERFLQLDSNIILSGSTAGDKALMPSIKASLTITGKCDAPYDGKCLINAQGLGAIFYADNSAFLPGMELTFENIIFLNGQSSTGQGGALANSGAMSVTFFNCDFINNAAGTGGAVAMVEGAFSMFYDCNFKSNAAATDGSGTGTGGAVLLTGPAGFTRCSFEENTGQNGGAVGVGGSSQGIFFDTCNFTDNSAEIFGNDIYMESWVITSAYFTPFPTKADIYTNPDNIKSMSGMPSINYPVSLPSPPPSPPNPPSPPPPGPPRPPDPRLWIYTEDQLWEALNNGNTSIILGAHIQFAQQGRWAQAPPPTIISEVQVVSNCEGYGQTCIIDLAGAKYPLFDVQTGGILKVFNVRIMNAATMADGGAVRLTAPRHVLFDTCDFIGNYATNGGAVLIKGGQNVEFRECNFGLNWADKNGGAISSVGSTVFFRGSSFYMNHANSGGAIALGPVSKVFLLDTEFRRNVAQQWGADVFLATPVGSSVYLSKWPPESVGKIFPPQADIKWYFAPPPAPPPPPSPPPAFKRAPYPPPGPAAPSRIKTPPPNPPNPPPNPPPRPPSPPMDHLVSGTPIMWGPLYVGMILLGTLGGLIYCAINQHRIFPRIKNPEELRRRLAGDWHASSDEDWSVDGISGLSDLNDDEVLEVTSAAPVEGAAGTVVLRRRPGEAEAAGAPEEWHQHLDGLSEEAGPSMPHVKAS